MKSKMNSLASFRKKEVYWISREKSFHLPRKTNVQYYSGTSFKWKRKCIGKINNKVRHFYFVKIFYPWFLRPRFSLGFFSKATFLFWSSIYKMSARVWSWYPLFLNVLRNVIWIPLLSSARRIVDKILKMNTGQKPTNSNNTLQIARK